MARLDYTKLNDYRKVSVGGAVYGGPRPVFNYKHDHYENNLSKPTKIKKQPLVGQARRDQEIKALQQKPFRTENQEKRLKSLLKLNKNDR